MAVISADTIKELEEQVNSDNTKIAVLVGYDDVAGKWVIAKIDSTTGAIKVDAS
jgi:hypothetical protein